MTRRTLAFPSGLVALGWLVACQGIVGIEDTSVQGASGAGASAGSAGVGASSGSGGVGASAGSGGSDASAGSGGSDASAGSGGSGGSSGSATGGQAGSGGAVGDASAESDGSLVNDFSIQILSSQVQIGLGGTHFLPVEIQRGAGFTAAVDVTLGSPPTGLTAQSLTIVAGETFGELQLSAKAPLAVGSTFTMKILGTSASLNHEASVNTIITEKSGSLDTGFASSGIHMQSFGQKEVEIYDIGVAGDARILFGGYKVGLSQAPLIGILAADGKKVDSEASIKPCSACSPGGITRGIAVLSTGHALFATDRTNDFALSKNSTTNLGLDQAFGSPGPGYTVLDMGGTDLSTGVAAFEGTSGTRLFAFGTSNNASAVAQLSSAGFQQKSAKAFGMTGSTHSSLAATPDGRVYMAGTVVDGGGKADMKLVALDSNLALDTGFNGTGFVTYGASGVDDKVKTVIAQADNKVLVAGSTNKSLWVRRYLPDGQPDTSFGANGLVSVAVNANSVEAADAVQFPDQRIVVLGNATGGNNPGPAALRLRRNGQADPSWGSQGEYGVIHPNLGQNAKIVAGAVQLSGTPAVYRLVIGGTADNIAQFNTISGIVSRVWY